jgi:hypothetical protein
VAAPDPADQDHAPPEPAGTAGTAGTAGAAGAAGTTGARGGAGAAGRRRLVAVAGHQGDVATARRHLDDPAPVVRATALRALERAGGLALDDVARAAGDPDPQVRRAAAELAATWPAPAGTAVTDDETGTGTGTGTGPDTAASHGADLVAGIVLGLLDDPDATVAETAAWAAGERPGDQPELVARLAEVATGHADHLVREAAVAALGALGDPAGLPAILAATRDRATVRRRAVLALAPFDGPEVDQALARARDDRDRQVRQAAEDLLD